MCEEVWGYWCFYGITSFLLSVSWTSFEAYVFLWLQRYEKVMTLQNFL